MAQRVAVVIGINYRNFPSVVTAPGELHELRFAEADAVAMAAVLQDAGYEVTPLLGAAATRETIINTLIEKCGTVDRDGVFVLHYAGHGDVDEKKKAYISSFAHFQGGLPDC